MRGRRAAAHSLPALAAGERLYVIGRQDATFPASGWHLPGEMGGIWAHPLRLARGFTLSLAAAGGRTALWRAAAYRQERLGARYRGSGPGGTRVERRDHAADDAPVLWVRLRLWAPAAGPARVDVRLDLLPHVRDVWPAGEPEAPMRGPLTLSAVPAPMAAWVRPGLGAVAASVVCEAPARFEGSDARGRWRATLALEPGQHADLHLVVAGGGDAQAAATTLAEWWSSRRTHVRARARAERAADRSARLRLVDAATTRAFADLGRSTRWLVRAVPGVGRGLTAGLADYPWWFGCDGAYVALGLLGAGQPELAKDTLEVVARAGLGSPRWPRIPHEVTTRGQVVHPGNAVETAHWAWAACHYVRMTADLDFARRHYASMRRGLASLLETGSLPSGFGIMEIAGLDQRLVDTAAYTWAALEGLADVAAALGRDADERVLRAHADAVAQAVEAGLWLDGPGVYADWRATTPSAEAVEGMRSYALGKGGPKAEARVAAALAALSDTESASRPFGNWAALTPLAVGLAAPDRAARVLRALRRSPARTGVGLALSENVRERPMTISTLVGAAAAGRYGATDLALAFLQNVTGATGRLVPRAVSEFLPEGGCFVQGWTVYARWVLLVDILGIEADAVRKRLTIRRGAVLPVPLAIGHLPAGDALVALRAGPDGCQVRIDRPGWTACPPGGPPFALAAGSWHRVAGAGS